MTLIRLACILVALALAVLLFTGCGGKPAPVVQPTIVTIREPFEVKVPVPVKVEAPAELLSALSMPLPLFVAPSDPLASSALTVEGERLLRAVIETLLGRLDAWRAWATAP